MITFFTQSNKEIAPVWMRIREGKIDAKARTLISVPQDRLVGSKVQLHRLTNSNLGDKAVIRQKNNALNVVQVQLDTLRRNIQTALNERDGDVVINSKWLKNKVQPIVIDNELTAYIDEVIKLKKSIGLTKNTIETYNTLKSLVNGYEKEKKTTLLINEIDYGFRNKLLTYLTEKGYSHNTKIMYIRTLKTVLKEAKKIGVKVCDYSDFSDGLEKDKSLNVYLTLDEIERIYNMKRDLTPQQSIARDWLIIGCNTAQRVGDLLNFKKDDITWNGSNGFLNVQQTKNKNSRPIQIPLLPQVKSILKKYNGNFPPPLNSDNANTNYLYYNALIKEVCRKAQIDDEVETLTHQKNNKKTNGTSEVITKPKWQCVSSHIGRRSFATNYYGKMNSASIMQITGHKTESSFLLYINRSRHIDLDQLQEDMMRFSGQN